ncbi:MAG: hypothetical protein HY343_09055 [Lentisphaerae bacterium]|nr:hypothetical protein [Lentisphaerota bacterium]
MKSTTIPSTTGASPFARPLRRDRRGVALILVLGMLAILIISAVTFAVSMRTERAAALYYANNLRAKQLAYAGLARAMEHIRLDMGSNVQAANAKVYPAWDAQSSFQWRTNMTLITNLSYMWDTNMTLITANMTNFASSSNPIFIAESLSSSNPVFIAAIPPFIPAALTGSVVAVDKACTNASPANNTWIYYHNFVVSVVSNQGGGFTTNRLILGRVSYLIVNCSGLLDANLAGSPTVARGLGASPAEIVLNGLPEFSVGGPGFFLNQRANIDKRYEMLDELAALNLLPQYNKLPENFATYSGAGTNYVTANNTLAGPVFLDANITNLVANRPAITNAFGQAGLTGFGYGGFSKPDILYWNLIDYVDTNSLPSSPIYGVDSAPCFSEIVVESVVTLDTPGIGPGMRNYRVQPTIQVEMFAPLSTTSSVFTLDLNCSVSLVSASVPGFSMASNTVSVPTSNAPPNTYAMAPNMPTPLLGADEVAAQDINYILKVDRLVLTNAVDNVLMDVLTAPIQFSITHRTPPPPYAATSAVASAEAQDPRFNAYTNDWVVRAGDSRGTTNLATVTYLAGLPNGDKDVVTFVANTNLQVVGELGYLAYDKGRTVRLCGPNPHRVVDTFTVRTNAFMRGLVNPNTRQTNVIASVFNGMPKDQYPGGPSNLVTWLVAQQIETFFMQTNTWASTNAGSNAFLNVSDIGKVDYFSADDDLTRESFVRNASGLFSPGQNLFTILVEAQASPGGMFNVLPPRQRAIALVWRDPYTGEFVIRSLKWLM